MSKHLSLLIIIAIVFVGCRRASVFPADTVSRLGQGEVTPAPSLAQSTATSLPTTIEEVALTETATQVSEHPEPVETTTAPTQPPTATNPPPTPEPTNTPIPPTQTPPPTPTPTTTPVPLCHERIPDDDLYTIVTRKYGMGAAYMPSDLVPLSNYFSSSITLGFDTTIRAVIAEPLQQMVNDMYAADLAPTIISGYRSHAEQAAAYDKWRQQYPDRVDILSAPPGTSEHQLGTTVDFGSPELNNEFHTHFYLTSEGEWLLENAYLYGFTLSYPLEAFEITNFYYEPWHYRYVGVELATLLRELDMSLTEYQLQVFPAPCVP